MSYETSPLAARAVRGRDGVHGALHGRAHPPSHRRPPSPGLRAQLLGIVDLLGVAPTWLTLFVPGAQLFLTVRVLRLLRIFRILKLTEYLSEAGVIIGALMYMVEGPRHGFDNILVSMYRAIVTLTTVGYGDLSPQTPLWKFLASMVMIIGYAIIAVPTRIVTSELTAPRGRGHSRQSCPACGREGHDDDATHCKFCGATL
ncbi:MAG TPA: potassium channel family protein [Thermoanaerobaculia bacterium]|nr:potassium channel family protein [Thermoanaerobaculia bacterium]